MGKITNQDQLGKASMWLNDSIEALKIAIKHLECAGCDYSELQEISAKLKQKREHTQGLLLREMRRNSSPDRIPFKNDNN